MELVYMWVEEYGNIRKQGFNFSPNYDINYNPDTKELKCEEKEIKQPKLFGEKISNITAIVGKNGSGKSTLLECIAKIFNNKESKENKIKVIDVNGRNIKEIKSFYYEDESSKNKVYFWGTFRLNTNNGIIKELKTIYFTNQSVVDSISGDFKGVDLSIYKNFFDNPQKESGVIKNNRINFLGVLNRENKTKIAGINYPKKIITKNNNDDFSSFYHSIKKTIGDKYSDGRFIRSIYWKSFNANNKDELLKEIDEILKKIKNPPKYNKNNIFNIFSTDYNNNDKTRKMNNDNDESYYNYLMNIKIFLERHFEKIEGNKRYDISEILDLINLYNYTYISTENKWLKFVYEPYLSSGEEHMLSLYGQFYNYLKDKKDKNYIILLDEPDIYMHPEWQRNIVNSINEFFSEILPNNQYQIILTSHSPFVASDLPRENVIMLDTYQEEDIYDKEGHKVKNIEQEIGNCKVLNDKDIKTFGANIFDLYSKAFFVESSFGEFAKGKIKDVVKDLTLNEKGKYSDLSKERIKEIEYVLNSIGEPLVKNKLQKMYDEYREFKIKKLSDDEKNKKIKEIIENSVFKEEDFKIYLEKKND